MPDTREGVSPELVHDDGTEDFILFAEGKLSADDRKLALLLLGRIGMETKFAKRSELEALAAVLHPPSRVISREEFDRSQLTEACEGTVMSKFTDVYDPDEYLIREHFEDFKLLHPELSRGVVFLARSRMLDTKSGQGNASGRRYSGESLVPMVGIEAVYDRTTLGLPPYERPLDKYGSAHELKDAAIKAGSILTIANELRQGTANLQAYQLAIVALADQLSAQFSL